MDADAFFDAAISHLATDIEELTRFLAQTGYSPDGLRAALGSPELQGALLDYFVSNEQLLLTVCANAKLDPQAVTNRLLKSRAERVSGDDFA